MMTASGLGGGVKWPMRWWPAEGILAVGWYAGLGREGSVPHVNVFWIWISPSSDKGLVDKQRYRRLIENNYFLCSEISMRSR